MNYKSIVNKLQLKVQSTISKLQVNCKLVVDEFHPLWNSFMMLVMMLAMSSVAMVKYQKNNEHHIKCGKHW